VFNLPSALDGLFENPFGDLSEASRYFGAWNPAVDVYEDKENLHVKVELPGLKREEIEVALEDGRLSISGERKCETTSNESRSYRNERYVGKFQRIIGLPSEVRADKVSAQYKDGVLTVTLPKIEAVKPKQIEVRID
jgi:HSP20 family protein